MSNNEFVIVKKLVAQLADTPFGHVIGQQLVAEFMLSGGEHEQS